MEREEIVAAIVAAAGGQFTGRVRLQKTCYLLDRLGFDSGFEFEYHHYGPFSRDLENATADAKAFDLLDERFAERESDGAAYSIYELTDHGREAVLDEAYGNLGVEQTTRLVQIFAETNVTILELAATVDWLWHFEECTDWRTEITRRKNRKVEGGRLEKAVQLLEKLGLTPPTPKTT